MLGLQGYPVTSGHAEAWILVEKLSNNWHTGIGVTSVYVWDIRSVSMKHTALGKLPSRSVTLPPKQARHSVNLERDNSQMSLSPFEPIKKKNSNSHLISSLSLFCVSHTSESLHEKGLTRLAQPKIMTNSLLKGYRPSLELVFREKFP